MNEQHIAGNKLAEAVWTRKFINDLPDSSFLYIEPGGEKDGEGKTKPRSRRHFPYKDAEGNVDLPHLRNALARIPQSKLPQEVKNRIVRKARRIAKDNGIDVSEEFLDDHELRGPLYGDWLYHTLAEFNSGSFDAEYVQEEIDLFGRKLAKIINDRIERSHDESNFDEDGNVVSHSHDSDSESESQWIYHDGLVVNTKRVSSWNSRMDREITSTDESSIAIEGRGADLYKLRKKRKMSRETIARGTKLSVARLREIEEGSDPDDDEMNQLAKAFGLSRAEFTRVVDRDSDESGEEHESDFVEIVDDVGFIEIVESSKQLLICEEFSNRFSEELDGYKLLNKLTGGFMWEAVKKKAEGVILFEAPLFKIGKLTSNGNEYTHECAEHTVDDVANMVAGESRRSGNGRSALEIYRGKTLDMRIGHASRFGESDPLRDKAGKITGARIGKVENDNACIIMGQTIPTNAGKDIAVLIEEKPPMVNGISLFGLPVKGKFEKNNSGGHKINKLMLFGADFTDIGGNLIQFNDYSNAGIRAIN